MTPTDFEVALLALFCWRYGNLYGMDVMVAMADLVKNLADANELSILDAIQEHARIHDLESDGQYPDVRDPLLSRLLSSVADVYYRRTPDSTNGALYVLDLSQKEETALRSVILRHPDEHPLCAIIGRFKYFK